MAKATKRAAAPKTRANFQPRGSIIGWTLISTALYCWWRFALRYIIGIVPNTGIAALDFGSVFHAALEGKSKNEVREWGVEYAQHIELAFRLAKTRIEKGPPMGNATAIEKTVPILNGSMTSKPDRVERDIMRDFKSAAFFSKHDQEHWDVNPGILGELIATQKQRAIVDVTRKPDGKTILYEVALTPAKERALKALVDDFWMQLGMRQTFGPSAFPRNMNNCTTRYGLCPYYDRCWGRGATRSLYKPGFTAPWWNTAPARAAGMSDPRRIQLAQKMLEAETWDD